jgi:ferric-dicitrate binding protein FerR (iron transport regulator)
MVNGAPMIPGATLFPGDVVRVGEDSTAALQFGASLVAATPVTEFVVETRGVNLRSGRLQVRASGNERIAVFGPFFSVDISPLGSTPSAAEIRLGGARAQISAVSGVADLTAAGNANSYKLHAGETATLDADSGDPRSPQGNVNQPAGQVARLYPGVRVDRSSQRFASVFDPVLWNDDFQSDRTGRAHLALNDGSQLNLGSDTTLRVLQHDAQAQQTSLDLIIGRMRGVVAKVTRPGGKFEIRTPVGVAGLVGTDFSLLVTNDYVELMVFDGAVAMTLFSNGRVVTVNAGMKVRFPRNGAVEIPSTATPQEMDLAKSLTDVPETAAGGPPAPGGVRPLLPVVVALASGAAVTGVAIWLDMRERKPVSPPNP